MNHVELFAGIGGICIAAERAGFTTVAQIERDPYCLRVLEKHWPDVHRCKEIRDFPDQDYEAVTLVSGGFPCQPFSQAGKRRGTDDDRHLWPEMFRVIQKLSPAWVLAENVPGLLAIEQGMVFESMLTDLEGTGYEAWTGFIPAAGVGAPHLRYRMFVVAYAGFKRWEREQIESSQCKIQAELKTHGNQGPLADTNRSNEYGRSGTMQMGRVGGKKETENDGYPERTQWSVESNVGRVAHGIPSRVDRLRALGNAVVPQQVYPILQAIADIEGK